MINFRFHLVSLIAVFLALGLGILVGSTVVDQVIVDRLDREISSVSHESNQIKSDNSALKDQVSKLNDFLKKSAAYSVQQRLISAPIAIIAEKGIDSGAVNAVLAQVRAAGADVPGVLWLDDKWKLDSVKDLTALHTAAKVTGSAPAARVAAMRALVTRLAEPQPAGARARIDVIEPLRSAGFLDFTGGKKAALTAFPEHPSRVLFLTGPDSDLAGTNSMIDLVTPFVAAKVPTVVAEVYDAKAKDGTKSVPKRGAAIAPVRNDPSLAKQVTTLDDAEMLQGTITAVISLEQVADGIVGHYGYGEGAGDVVPPIPS
jgi:hypothetical protein